MSSFAKDFNRDAYHIAKDAAGACLKAGRELATKHGGNWDDHVNDLREIVTELIHDMIDEATS